MSDNQKVAIETLYRAIVGPMNWLSVSTRPDISAITNMLARHQNHPTPAHLGAAKYVIRYLKGTKHKGLIFSSKENRKLHAFTSFNCPHGTLVGMSDANWGPQDASLPNSKTTKQVTLDTSRSQVGYVLCLFGSLTWDSIRSKTTARSSCQAEIYSAD